LNIPLIKELNVPAFTYAELAFYPSLKVKGLFDRKILKDNTKLSGGFGVCLPVNQIITILLYYNAFNFNSQRSGDFERTGYLNFNIGFF
jgi:hypothetical protein